MITYFFKAIIRHARRHKLFTLLNIAGLAIGMAVCLLISLYIKDELSYDLFHEHADRIYRVDMTNIWAEENERFGSTPPPVASLLRSEYPEIATAVRIHTPNLLYFSVQEGAEQHRIFEEENALAVDSGFFDVFSVQKLQGEPEKALTQPNEVVLTEATAKKYFDDQDPVGRLLTLEVGGEKKTIKVGGVVASLPEQSHFQFDMLLSMPTFPEVKEREDIWVWTTFVTYVKLKEEANTQQLSQKISDLPSRYAGAVLERIYGYSFEEYEQRGKKWELFLLPLTDIHLFSNDSYNRLGATGDVNNVYIILTIGLLIMVLAIINFVNLSTASSAHRAKEVGVRKVLGSARHNLLSKFLGESVLYAMVALVLALSLTELLRPFFNQISGKQLSLLDTLDLEYGGLIFGCALLTGVLAGMYPAFFMSSFNPIKALKKNAPQRSSIKSLFLRNGLVTFQFIISISLIIFTLVIYRQLNYTQNKSLGFSSDHLIILHQVEQLPNEGESLLNQLREDIRIAEASLSNFVPPSVWGEDNFAAYGSDEAAIPVNTMIVDAHFIPTLDIQLLNGRNFTEDSEAERQAVILNEHAVKSLGWSTHEDSANYAVGQYLQYTQQEKYEVIGIARDFNFQSLHQDIMPLALFPQGSSMWGGSRRFFTIRPASARASMDEIQETIQWLKEEWQAYAPYASFRYSFLKDDYYAQFQTERKLGMVLGCLTLLAIFIACMGVFGLVTFTAERKRKEIGIRKVLGATVAQLFLTVSKDFSRPILIALLIAIPLAWYYTENWLQNFAYRTNIPFWLFIVAGLCAFAITLISVSYQSIAAATTDPVKSLREE
ncbi:ABC transporter permease [Catalinimonas sp. 4WD22]|uniref:ABC transporter permease n=1 Tax=Catalinimonas locisalis TaxID=3133978 RepID=UPI003100CA28